MLATHNPFEVVSKRRNVTADNLVGKTHVVTFAPRDDLLHHENQVTSKAIKFAPTVGRDPEVDMTKGRLHLGDVAKRVEKWIVPNIRVFIPDKRVAVNAVTTNGNFLALRVVNELACDLRFCLHLIAEFSYSQGVAQWI